MSKINFSRFLASNWVITLTATLIGVFLALYLNERVASNKLNNQKVLATQNILTEISSNQESLEKSIQKHTELLETMEFLNKYLNDEDDLIAPVDSMNKFKAKYPDFVSINDSSLLENGYCRYNGEINLDLTFPHVQLSSIAWNTLKNSGISTTYNFECLMYLESIDKLTNEVFEKNDELLEFMTGLRETGVKNRKFLSHLKFLLDFEKSLIQIYKNRDQELKNCE